MRKKVLIINHAMEIGGAERALLGLLNSFDFEEYNVDLFLARHEGDLLSFVPKQVHLLDENQANCLATPMKSLLKFGKLKMLYGRLKAKILAKRNVKKLGLGTDNQVELTYSHKYTYKYLDFINSSVEYDLAISFLTPHYICMNRCNAKKKIAWIHTDYSTIDIDVQTELDMWDKYDYIASISDQCTKSFLSKMPSLENKIVRIDNILARDVVWKQAEEKDENVPFTKDTINLLSIGRYSVAKNFDNVSTICKYLVDMGLKIKWYIIGFGGDEQLIKDKIKEEDMEDTVVLLGKKINPYPYIKQCDFYVQPSRYEGKAVTVREAQILEKPVIITRFPTSKSQLEDGVDGVIVEMDNKECAKGIYDFITNKERVNKIINNLKSTNYSNESEIHKLYDLIGD